MKPILQVGKNLYRSSKPDSVDDLRRLSDLGFATIICLEEGWSWLFGAYQAEKDWESQPGKSYIKIALSNFFFPSKDELENICKIIDSTEAKVLVHCKAGVDRTGVVSGYYLWKAQEVSPEKAWAYIGVNGMHWWYRILWEKSFFKACE